MQNTDSLKWKCTSVYQNRFIMRFVFNGTKYILRTYIQRWLRRYVTKHKQT